MNKFALVVAFCVLSMSALAAKYNKVVELGDAMPAFELPDVSGGTVKSADLDGDIVVLVSLTKDCPWVKGMDAGLVALADQYGEKSVDIVGFSVNLREGQSPDAMQAHAEQAGYTFPYVFDASQSLGRQLGATRTPEYFVYNQDRELVYYGLLYDSPAKMGRDGSVSHINGEPTEFYVADAIDATRAGNSVTLAETRAHGCSVRYE